MSAETLSLSERLSESQIYRDYQLAFSEATGMPLVLKSAHQSAPAFRGNAFANEFCKQMVATAPGCQLCIEMQERLGPADSTDAQTGTCRAGLTDSMVPIRLGDKTIGFLQTGQIALRRTTRSHFRQVAEWLVHNGVETDWKELEKSYLGTKVVDRHQYEAMVKLLEVFAQHLALAAERLATTDAQAEPPMIQRARHFINEHQQDDISLADAAKAVNASTFHFCKMFKKATGLTFTEYLALVRVTKAKRLLLNPNARISEVAYEVGFNSLTHFNRTFRKLTGQSPTAFRSAVSS